jgi:2,4-dienoyl-CoA reductase (NADPH2)
VRPAEVVVLCTGSRPGERPYRVSREALVLDVRDVRAGTATLPDEGDILVYDPVGGPIGVAMAEELGTRAVLVTQDNIAGNELSRTGDLAPANVRLAQRGVRIEKRSLLRAVRKREVELEDRFTGTRRSLPAVAVIDAGFRLPDDALWEATGHRHLRAGDAVAPRTYLEAILEGRRAALAVDTHR